MKEFVKENFAETKAVLSEMIACNTENPPGDEYLCAEVVIRFLEKYQIPYKNIRESTGSHKTSSQPWEKVKELF